MFYCVRQMFPHTGGVRGGDEDSARHPFPGSPFSPPSRGGETSVAELVGSARGSWWSE